MPAVNTDAYGQLAILPYQAISSFDETLQWFTDVIPSYSGKEERLCLRAQPRQGFNSEIIVQNNLVQDAFNTIYAAVGLKWAIPVWSEAQYVGNLSAGAQFCAIVDAYYDLRTNGLALLTGDCGAFQVISVINISGGYIYFDSLPSDIRNAYLQPLRVGRVIPPIGRKSSGFNSLITIQYAVDDNFDFDPDAPTQFLGDDIYFDAPVSDGDRDSQNITTNLETFDFDVGDVRATSAWLFNRLVQNYNVVTRTPAEAWALRMWLHRRKGKYQAFWQPSFEHDVRLVTTGTLTDSIVVRKDSRTNWEMVRPHIAVEATDGAWYPRVITNVAPSGDNLQFTLDSALGIDATEIRRISYLGLKRLNADSVTLRWGGNGSCRMSVQTIELTA
jgi:hypothetical protein